MRADARRRRHGEIRPATAGGAPASARRVLHSCGPPNSWDSPRRGDGHARRGRTSKPIAILFVEVAPADLVAILRERLYPLPVQAIESHLLAKALGAQRAEMLALLLTRPVQRVASIAEACQVREVATVRGRVQVQQPC